MHVIVFDVEATGLDIQKDRIVSLSAVNMDVDGPSGKWLDIRCNPGFDMSEEVVAVHGITNLMARSYPSFESQARLVHAFFSQPDTAIAGFNHTMFDLPLLWEEFHRAGIEWVVPRHIIDVGNIFKKREERTLSAAVKFYCNREHTDAHSARGDVEATIDVFLAQQWKYPDLMDMTVEEIAAYSQFDEQSPRVDFRGTIRLNERGEYVYGTYRNRGVKVSADPGYAEWMLRTNFPANTHWHIRRVLNEIEEQDRRPSYEQTGPEADDDGDDIPF